MKHPQLIVVGLDGWLGKQLRELAADARWVLHEVRQTRAALAAATESPRPTVVFVQADPHADPTGPFGLVAELYRRQPDAAAVVVADAKLADADRAAWAAAAMDLGARYVLFPPLARPVLEDVASGLMAAAVRRAVPDAPPLAAEPVIDLAEEGQAER
jgi:hypothetical protein